MRVLNFRDDTPADRTGRLSGYSCGGHLDAKDSKPSPVTKPLPREKALLHLVLSVSECGTKL